MSNEPDGPTSRAFRAALAAVDPDLWYTVDGPTKGGHYFFDVAWRNRETGRSKHHVACVIFYAAGPKWGVSRNDDDAETALTHQSDAVYDTPAEAAAEVDRLRRTYGKEVTP